MKNFLKVIGVLAGVVSIAFIAFCGWLMTTELTDAYEELDD